MSDELTGRELDAAIAERCFEWQWWAFASDDRGYLAGIIPPPAGRPESTNKRIEMLGERVDSSYPRFEDWDTISGDPLPHYSENMSDAWQVAEWIRAQTGVFVLAWDVHLQKWQCTYSNKGVLFPLFVTAPTAEEAICRAALKLADRLAEARE